LYPELNEGQTVMAKKVMSPVGCTDRIVDVLCAMNRATHSFT
jgi:hypothetical protein